MKQIGSFFLVLCFSPPLKLTWHTLPFLLCFNVSVDQSQGRSRLERFDFTNSDRQDNMNYVGLQTPPRILTMEEAFEFTTNGDDMEEFIRKPMHGSLPNG